MTLANVRNSFFARELGAIARNYTVGSQTSGGVDAVIFTAGVGENSPEVRAAACENLGYLNLKVDLTKNLQSFSDQDIATADSCVHALVIHARKIGQLPGSVGI